MDKVTPIGSPKAAVKRRARSTPSPRASRHIAKEREVWETATRAYNMRVEGKLPSEIAEILGISATEVHRLFTERFAYDAAYLSDADRKSILSLELARLDALQTAVWASAMMGDPKSVDSAIKIIQARAKITGIEQADPVVNKNLVLVMGEREEDYIAALKATSTD